MDIMELQKVTFEQAQRLKEIGFPQGGIEKCYIQEDNKIKLVYANNELYSSWIVAPSLELAAKWLREEKGLYIEPEYCLLYDKYDYCLLIKEGHITMYNDDKGYKTYEEALSAGIDKAIEILKIK